ncbi:hypothetical protein PFLCHA0_c29800 [Pseudomonas protegens CHA0]|jgi:hypothetical protein|uniref:Uncharacterized protein n=1 Tax=Pseudomonas protegens (strain DSM 19095 / LMG 27888 / CFBP 6595 / CHA0) TaxID=1124983 RepID=A0A2C9EM70_PSEPH|nr:hypothetical protein PFLCHA0_c29800 [Pseudomonas protegens CHA0]
MKKQKREMALFSLFLIAQLHFQKKHSKHFFKKIARVR